MTVGSDEDYGLPAELAGGLMTPALVIFRHLVRENVAAMLRLTGGPDRWRPHVKTCKTPFIFRDLAVAGLRRFKCATLREAEALLGVLDEMDLDDGDVLVAYPFTGPALAQLGDLHRKHPRSRLSVLVEDPVALESVPEGVGVFIDVNVGMDRTGIVPSERAVIREMAMRAGDAFRGIHAYEGHVHSGSLDARRVEAATAHGPLVFLVQELAREGTTCGEVSTSGTPSCAVALESPKLAELATLGIRHTVSPGTVVLHDMRSAEVATELPLIPAALVLSRVVSHPKAGRFTCDAGSKALAAEAGDPCAHIPGRPDCIADVPSEEHLPFDTKGSRPSRGETVLLVPRHVCPTVNLHEHAVIIERGELVGIHPVSARAHGIV